MNGVALAALLAWLALLLGRGRFHAADARLPPAEPPGAWPAVVAVIPARDEAEHVAATVLRLAGSRYGGALSVVVVDDGSTDGTASVAAQAGAAAARPVRVIAAPPRPPGWSGKLWALRAGLAEADRIAPEARWALLCDAEILHAPDHLARLVAGAEAEGRALVSVLARLDARGFWGGLLIPAFVFFFQKLYPFRWVADPARRAAAAAGGCVLVRRDALAGIGGTEAVRGALIDDVALARAIKRGPPARAIRLTLARGDELVSARDNRSLGVIWAMVTRTAYVQLDRSPALLALCLAGMALVYLAGPALALGAPLHGEPLAAIAGAAAWGMMAAAYRPTLRLYGRPAWQGLGLPLAATLYMAMTAHAALRWHLGRGSVWKGRAYGRREDGSG